MADANSSVATIVSLVVGVGIAILALIFTGALGGATVNEVIPDIDNIGTATTATNESFTIDNTTAQTLSNTHLISVTEILNTTTNAPILTSNFTVNLLAGTILLSGDTGLNGSSGLITYTYHNATIRSSIMNSYVSGFEAFEKTGSYLPIIVLAVVITLVLGLVLTMGGVAGRRGGGGMAL